MGRKATGPLGIAGLPKQGDIEKARGQFDTGLFAIEGYQEKGGAGNRGGRP